MLLSGFSLPVKNNVITLNVTPEINAPVNAAISYEPSYRAIARGKIITPETMRHMNANTRRTVLIFMAALLRISSKKFCGLSHHFSESE